MSDWPIYGKHYRAGYFGFSTTRGSVVSEGILAATADDNRSGFPWSHVFIVVSEDTIIEATSPRVCMSRLAKYTETPRTAVAFRRPRFYSEQFADSLIVEAVKDLGKAYDTPLLAAHLINKLTAGIFERQISALFDNRQKYICSEWAAEKLLAVRPTWNALRGTCLAMPPNTINPQEFFEDTAIWDLWHDAGDPILANGPTRSILGRNFPAVSESNQPATRP